MNKPLQGLKALELASVLAGPAVGTFLVELGADVIKIENPKTGGDVTRSWKLSSEDANAAESAYFASVNYRKQHRFLNLSDALDLKTVKTLAAQSDIIIANFRSGQAEKFGLDYQSVSETNPKVIYGNITGFGADDNRPAFDVVLQAETGYMFMNGNPGSEPTKMPVALVDVLAAHQLKEGILLALLQLQRTGQGALVEVSLFDAAVSALTNQASNWLMNGHIPQRIGSLHPNIAPYGEILQTKDDKMIVLAVGSNAQCIALFNVLGLDELAEDERFSDNQQRIENRFELKQLLDEKANEWNCDDLMHEFLKKNVPAGVVKNMQEVFENLSAQQLVVEEGQTKRVSQIAFKISG
jgi:crotonobetainyl-CoA:carnitine CoA-transferase CaiB-like acyl-CoA transferase